MFPFEASLANAADHRQATGRPLVTLTYAQSLDGSIASGRGQPLALKRPKPLTLSGAQSLKLTHQLRAAHDAILVGIGTVLADDPRLTVRLAPGRQPQPLVLDSHLRMPLSARLVAEPGRPLWIAASREAPEDRRLALEARGVHIFELPAGPDSRLSLEALLNRLAENGINSLMVEGGAEVIASFLRQQLVNQVVLTIAPCFVGGLTALDTPLVDDFPRLADMKVELLGEDLIVWGTLPACQ